MGRPRCRERRCRDGDRGTYAAGKTQAVRRHRTEVWRARATPVATGSVLCLVLAAALALGGCTTSIPSVSTARASTTHSGDQSTVTAGKQVGTGAPASAQSAQLERVVVVFRHGVRAPLQGEAAAAHYADQPWPQWSTPASLLTPHGRQGVRLSGEYLRQWLVQQALLPRSGCPATGSMSVWANTDQRTIESGALLADALAPGCGIVAGHREAGSNDPLFRPIEAGTLPFDAAAAVASIQQQTEALPPCCKATPPSCRHCSRFWAARGRPAISRRCLPRWRRRPTGVGLS